jgi:hypothetical protein
MVGSGFYEIYKGHSFFCYINSMSKDKSGLGDMEFAGKKTQTFKQFQLKSLIQWEQQNEKTTRRWFLTKQ